MDTTPAKLTQTALQNILKQGVFKLTPHEAFTQGLNIRSAAKTHPQEVRTVLLTMLGDLCRFIDAKRTLTTDEDLIFTVDAILEGYPALKLEELRLIIDGMKRGQYGKFYERLKLAEIEEAIKTYEGTIKAEVLEKLHQHKIVTRGVDDVSKINYEPQSMADVKRKRWQEVYGNFKEKK